jgi:hypothetical protein
MRPGSGRSFQSRDDKWVIIATINKNEGFEDRSEISKELKVFKNSPM